MKTLLITALSLILTTFTLHAQDTRSHLMFGIGPSFIYGDNSGDFSSFNFQVRPALSFAYNQQFNERFDWRVTAGTQWLNSGQYRDYPVEEIVEWSQWGRAVDFTGQAYHLDFMPVYHFTPADWRFDYYAGICLGVLHVNRTDEVIPTGVDPETFPMNERFVEVDGSSTSLYFPVRLGVSTHVTPEWSVGIELSSLISTSPNVDGNDVQWKTLGADMLFQLQFTVKRYFDFGRWWSRGDVVERP
jgi:hypothetical protein